MILEKTANESTFFTIFYHRLKFWTLNFNVPYLLQKSFAHHGFLFNNDFLHVNYHSSKFVRLVANTPYDLTVLAWMIAEIYFPNFIYYFMWQLTIKSVEYLKNSKRYPHLKTLSFSCYSKAVWWRGFFAKWKICMKNPFN